MIFNFCLSSKNRGLSPQNLPVVPLEYGNKAVARGLIPGSSTSLLALVSKLCNPKTFFPGSSSPPTLIVARYSCNWGPTVKATSNRSGIVAIHFTPALSNCLLISSGRQKILLQLISVLHVWFCLF